LHQKGGEAKEAKNGNVTYEAQDSNGEPRSDSSGMKEV
jgi:hypothetical protein